ncbi:hypothetical protein LQZ44_12115 [Alcaligenes nematophilus]|uniref:hypothetical protein n=1 Tax=Alcaligenes nematophilus TaxID=2994643 RepID=UPI0035B51155
MSQAIKDEIARLRYEAKHFRDLAKIKRSQIADLKKRPIGSRDPVAVLKAQDRVSEYVRDAQNCEAKIKEWRAQLGK